MFVAASTGTSVGKISNFKFLDGNWHHFVGVFIGSGSNADDFSIYIDNILISQSNTNTGSFTLPINNNSNIVIGSSHTDGFPFFNGQIDDVRIYNRTLTITEIEYLSKN